MRSERLLTDSRCRGDSKPKDGADSTTGGTSVILDADRSTAWCAVPSVAEAGSRGIEGRTESDLLGRDAVRLVCGSRFDDVIRRNAAKETYAVTSATRPTPIIAAC